MLERFNNSVNFFDILCFHHLEYFVIPFGIVSFSLYINSQNLLIFSEVRVIEYTKNVIVTRLIVKNDYDDGDDVDDDDAAAEGNEGQHN
jgi:hypothetical protein